MVIHMLAQVVPLRKLRLFKWGINERAMGKMRQSDYTH